MILKTSPIISGSSAEVGSSNKITSGFIIKLLAMAMRCFCPPESLCGITSFLSDNPTFLSKISALFIASSSLKIPVFTGAKHKFCNTFLLAKRLKC